MESKWISDSEQERMNMAFKRKNKAKLIPLVDVVPVWDELKVWQEEAANELLYFCERLAA